MPAAEEDQERTPRRRAPLSPQARELLDWFVTIAHRHVPDLAFADPPLKQDVISANRLLQSYPLARLRYSILWSWEDEFWSGKLVSLSKWAAHVGTLVAKSARDWETARDAPATWDVTRPADEQEAQP
jgi:hypothetical protein